MRLHRLRLQAFGPFAGTEEIDFDALAGDGLHLIHGPTGAGKTSILDAICFALFAGVPGGRMQGRDTLRSDHAAPAVRPEVELEFGLGERRFRVRRLPECQVPKKRGTGTRTQRSSVELLELRSGAWEPVSSRADEVAQEIGDLLGMGLPQFAQVMLLPQGDFTAFLRAKPDERGALLERLFDISEFAEIEKWLLAHRKTLEIKVIEARSQRDAMITRVQDVLAPVDTSPSEAPPLGQLAPVELHRTLGAIAGHLSARLSEQLAGADAARAVLDHSRCRLAAERSLAALQQQARGAQRILEEVAEHTPQLEHAEARLTAASRADRCMPAIAALHRRRAAERAGRQDVCAARADLESATRWAVPEVHGAALGRTALDALAERATAGTSALAARPELQRRLRAVEQELRTGSDRLAAADRDAAARRNALQTLQARQAQLARAREAELPVAAAHPQWQRWHDLLRAAADGLCDAVAQAETAAEHRHCRLDAQHSWADAEQQVIELRASRLAGFAAELAIDLTDGAPCPVCGATTHPHPAERTPDHVDAKQLTAAENAAKTAHARLEKATAAWSSTAALAGAMCRRAADDLLRLDDFHASDSDQPETIVRDHQVLAGPISTLRPLLVAAGDDLSGDSPTLDDQLPAALRRLATAVQATLDPATAHLAAAAASAERLRAADDQLASIEEHLTEADSELTAAQDRARLADTQVQTLRAQVEATRARDAELLAQHETACGCSGSADTAPAHARSVELLHALVDAAALHRSAVTEVDAALHELDEALASAGFADEQTAARASMTETQQRELRAQVEATRTRRLKAAGVLEQADVAAAVLAAPAQVEQAAEDVAIAERSARHTAEAVGEVQRALATLERLTRELREHDQRTAPILEDLGVATRLASAVSGSGDNVMRMRLTAYVLAARLETVTALANERLQAMTDGRYQLEHTDERANRGGKSGLGLRVRDAWTGTTRDTATLSGGESFIASLALALGLGDAVLQSAGGRRLETLLVDEGFGSLDEDSLEHVLDVLDGLRACGRSVGIVSHVAELRTRIPSQIRVRKTTTGSTLEVRHATQVA